MAGMLIQTVGRSATVGKMSVDLEYHHLLEPSPTHVLPSVTSLHTSQSSYLMLRINEFSKLSLLKRPPAAESKAVAGN